MEKIYELIIPSWNAAIPKDWPLKISASVGRDFVAVGGSTISIVKGTQLTGGPQELFDNMLTDGYIKEMEN